MKMEKKKLERIIKIIREEMGSAAVTPTNSTGPNVAEFSPVMGKEKKRKPTPLGRYRTRVNWRQKDES